MNQDIYYTKQPDNIIGLEIIPPLGEIAAEGLAKALTHAVTAVDKIRPAGAYVTRDDESGTALIVKFETVSQQPVDAAILARRLMDPTHQHQISIH